MRRLTVKTKQCDLKETVTVTPFALQSNCVGDGAIYSRVPSCCERKVGGWQSRYRSRWSDCQADSRYSKAADESCAYQKGILVQKKSSVIGWRRIFLTKMCYRRRQGYLPKLVTKMNEMPTTFVSLVVKRNCTGGSATVSFMGISRSELFPGFNRYTTEWKSPPYGCRLGLDWLKYQHTA